MEKKLSWSLLEYKKSSSEIIFDTSHVEKRAAPKRIYPISTKRQVVIGIVTFKMRAELIHKNIKLKNQSTYQREILHKFKFDCIIVHLTDWHTRLPGTLASHPLHHRSRRVGACVLWFINFLSFLEIVDKISKYTSLLFFQTHCLRRINCSRRINSTSIKSETVIPADFAWAGNWSPKM